MRQLARADDGFTLIETLVSGVTTAIVIALVGGVLYGGGKGFAAGGSNYLAAEELAQFGHYVQTDLASTPPENVAVSGTPCMASGDVQSGNTLSLAWTDPNGTGHAVTYVVAGDTLERTATSGASTTSTGIVHHLDNTASGGGVCYQFTPQAGEVRATVNLEMALMMGAEHKYQGAVVAYEQAEAGLQ